MQKAFADGFQPDVISTDVVTHSIYRKSVFALPYQMSEFLQIGMSLPDIVKAVTETPAHLMHLDDRIGTLKPGALADVAIMQLLDKPVVFRDQVGNSLPGKHLFVPLMTIKAGRIAYRRIEFTF